eukprot:8922802-Lingulodinium_polyedra.AAC.1
MVPLSRSGSRDRLMAGAEPNSDLQELAAEGTDDSDDGSVESVELICKGCDISSKANDPVEERKIAYGTAKVGVQPRRVKWGKQSSRNVRSRGGRMAKKLSICGA